MGSQAGQQSIKNQKLLSKQQQHTLKELIESKVVQKLMILSNYVPKLQRQIKSQYYNAAKSIFGIKGNPEASKFPP